MSIHPRDECPAVYAISVLCQMFSQLPRFSTKTQVLCYISVLRQSQFGALQTKTHFIATILQKPTSILWTQKQRNMASSEASGGHKKGNRLLKERSPYLLQHAYNPVDW